MNVAPSVPDDMRQELEGMREGMIAYEATNAILLSLSSYRYPTLVCSRA